MTEPWSYSVGDLPHKVTVLELPERGHRLYLRWRNQRTKNWGHRSLKKMLRTPSGRIQKDVERWAIQEARQKHEELLNHLSPVERHRAAPLTLAQATALMQDRDRGCYPKDTPHRREVLKAMADAIRIWGGERTFASIGKADIRELGRRRARELRQQGHVGVRGAEITVGRLLAVAQWLRDEGHIEEGQCLPESQWKKKLREELEAPEPHRPRYTLEEMRALIRNAPLIEPRYGLLIVLGAELRLGQVRKQRRSDLDLEAGTFTVRGRGKKRGAVVHLTPGQRAVVGACLTGGYLRDLEALAIDYPLFPQGQLRGGRKGMGTARATQAQADPVTATAIRQWHGRNEEACHIEHLPGRGPYGIRRQAVDATVEGGASRDELKEIGGWSDTQVPERIYRDQESKAARDGAKTIRARIRGEEAHAEA
jgi:integrase